MPWRVVQGKALSQTDPMEFGGGPLHCTHCHEITHEMAPPVAVIDAAVELAREFGGEHSPAFVNAVLDRWWKDRGGKR